MKKLFKTIKLKNIIALSLCFMLCFSCIFIASGCFMGDPGNIDDGNSSGTGDSSGGKTGGEGVDAGNTTNGVILTIDANGGSYDGYSTYKISREEGTTIILKVPTYDNEDYDYTFAGWIKMSGNGTLNGNSFTFGSQATEIKATWTGGILEELDANDYIKGATILYKPLPEQNQSNVLSIKTRYITKINALLTKINTYINNAFAIDDELENTILFNYLNSAYDVTIPSEVTTLNDKINYLLPYVDHYGLFKNEEQTLTQVILDIIGKEKITADEALYYNKDGVAGFGAEKFYGTVDSTDNTLSKDSNYKYDDLNGNEMFDLWTKETFIAKGYCTEDNYDKASYYYGLKLDNDGNLILDAKGLSSEYTIRPIKVNSAANDLNTKDITLYVFADANSNLIYDKTPDENVNDPEMLYYYDVNGSYHTYLDLSTNYVLFSYKIVGAIKGNTYYPANDYKFDMAQTGFKNYKNVVKACVENISNEWKIVPIIYIQQLNLKDMSVDFSDTDADFYDNDILTNKPNSGVSLQGMILDVKQKVNIKSIEVYFEFINEQNLGANEIEINIGATYYNKNENATRTLKLGKVKVQEGETQAIGENLDNIEEGSSDSVDIDFTKEYGSNGVTLGVFEIELNNDNYEDYFSATMGESGSVASYTDYSSDFLLLTFEAEKINGVTPSFKICFFNFNLVEAE